MENRSGQISVEFIMLLALALIIFIPLVYFVSNAGIESTDNLRGARSSELLSRIIDEAGEMYYLGTYSKERISISVPEGTNNVSVIRAVNVTPPNDERYYLEMNVSVGGADRLFTVSSDVPIYADDADGFDVADPNCVALIDRCTSGFDCVRCSIEGMRPGSTQQIELSSERGPVSITRVV